MGADDAVIDADARLRRIDEFTERFEARVLERGFVSGRELASVLKAIGRLRSVIGVHAANAKIQEVRIRLRLLATSIAETREAEPAAVDLALERALACNPDVD